MENITFKKGELIFRGCNYSVVSAVTIDNLNVHIMLNDSDGNSRTVNFCVGETLVNSVACTDVEQLLNLAK